MPQSWNRKNTEERKRMASEVVFSLLPSDGSKIQWKELAKATGKQRMTKMTLSAHLKDFIRLGMIERSVDSSMHPPKVYYSKTEHSGSPPHENEVGIRLYKPTKDDLAKFQASGGNIDDLISANSFGILSMLSHAVLRSLWTAMVAHIQSIPPGQTDKNWSVRTRVKLHPETKAHDILDKEIDVGLRPLAHKTLSFYYSVDPRNNLPLIANDKLFLHLDQLIVDSWKPLEEHLRMSVVEKYVSQGKHIDS